MVAFFDRPPTADIVCDTGGTLQQESSIEITEYHIPFLREPDDSIEDPEGEPAPDVEADREFPAESGWEQELQPDTGHEADPASGDAPGEPAHPAAIQYGEQIPSKPRLTRQRSLRADRSHRVQGWISGRLGRWILDGDQHPPTHRKR